MYNFKIPTDNNEIQGDEDFSGIFKSSMKHVFHDFLITNLCNRDFNTVSCLPGLLSRLRMFLRKCPGRDKSPRTCRSRGMSLVRHARRHRGLGLFCPGTTKSHTDFSVIRAGVVATDATRVVQIVIPGTSSNRDQF